MDFGSHVRGFPAYCRTKCTEKVEKLDEHRFTDHHQSPFHRCLYLPGLIVPLVAWVKPRDSELSVDKKSIHASEGP